MKLDIACGARKAEGFTGIDIAPGSDIVHDLFVYPWPLEDDSVEEARVQHFVEHIPHYRPEWGGVDGWHVFWDEVWRICKPGAIVKVIHPYLKSDRAFWDPGHTRYIHEMSWYYLSRDWLRIQELEQYPGCADFEVVVIAGQGVADDIATRNEDFKKFAQQHYWNVIADLEVTLRVKKG